MELGLGKLQWNPETFWNSTLIELTHAANGLAKLHGSEEESKSDPLDRAGFEKLKEKLGG